MGSAGQAWHVRARAARPRGTGAVAAGAAAARPARAARARRLTPTHAPAAGYAQGINCGNTSKIKTLMSPTPPIGILKFSISNNYRKETLFFIKSHLVMTHM